ncbi:unnamed protein product [Arabis nemorensis]|uniref:Uncharacterized protein n=1 Tax=Arabis nemorensis TaxID=586526 RepID=A0A565CUE5_9BRAS|nr:unnamed protein product [Arabis nemorensis]
MAFKTETRRYVNLDLENGGLPYGVSNSRAISNTRKFLFQKRNYLVSSWDIYACEGSGGFTTQKLDSVQELNNEVDIEINVIRVPYNPECAIVAQGFGGTDSVQIVAKSRTLTNEMIHDMEANGFIVSIVRSPKPTKNKNIKKPLIKTTHTDMKILQLMSKWCRAQEYLVPIVMISNDTKLTPAVEGVVNLGYQISLVHAAHASDELVTAATKTFDITPTPAVEGVVSLGYQICLVHVAHAPVELGNAATKTSGYEALVRNAQL